MTSIEVAVPTDRVSTGVLRLDTMLSGGYYRGSSVLISGFPGTATSTLSCAFAEAAWEKERAESVSRKDLEAIAKHKQAIFDGEEAELEAISSPETPESASKT